MKETKYNDGQNDLVCKKSYRKDGSVIDESYWLYDKSHRTDGPAFILYYEDGSSYCEQYCLNNKLHRTDGPARIYYNKDGSVRREEYWLNGNILTREIRNDRINKALFKGKCIEVGGKLWTY